jgi:hypothetical protein
MDMALNFYRLACNKNTTVGHVLHAASELDKISGARQQ